MKTSGHSEWTEYREHALARLTPALAELGYALDLEQPHLAGERAIIRPITGGRKLVLLGRRVHDHLRVVIKASDDPAGVRELTHERLCRTVLNNIAFSYQIFVSPEELLFTEREGFTLAITEYIEQDRAFLERPLKEQFALALAAFKAQENAHATTYEHRTLVADTFGEMTAADYAEKIRQYAEDLAVLVPEREGPVALAIKLIVRHQETLDRYGDFLTHWDFTPQNFRIRDGALYLLDHSSLRFGNKYEGWARFINFMTLYNPPLAEALSEYVRQNRTPEELLALKCMRVFRLVELIRYYASWLERTEGDLHALAEARITFWAEVLACVLEDRPISGSLIQGYKTQRDQLRSDDEKRRQQGLH
ncbi:MAG: hypothetical protein ACREGR_04995 [Minisyncoccia bacterium]